MCTNSNACSASPPMERSGPARARGLKSSSLATIVQLALVLKVKPSELIRDAEKLARR